MFPTGWSMEGSLEVRLDGYQAHVSAQNQEIVVDLDDPRGFLTAMRMSIGSGRQEMLGSMRAAALTLHEAGITVRVVNRGNSLFVLGRNAQGGAVGFMVPHLQVGVAELFRLLTA